MLTAAVILFLVVVGMSGAGYLRGKVMLSDVLGG